MLQTIVTKTCTVHTTTKPEIFSILFNRLSWSRWSGSISKVGLRIKLKVKNLKTTQPKDQQLNKANQNAGREAVSDHKQTTHGLRTHANNSVNIE
jgi:hypothetical protein